MSAGFAPLGDIIDAIARRMDLCPVCKGSGEVWPRSYFGDLGPEVCAHCNGSGKEPRHD